MRSESSIMCWFMIEYIIYLCIEIHALHLIDDFDATNIRVDEKKDGGGNV
jgi:hypothetical protein